MKIVSKGCLSYLTSHFELMILDDRLFAEENKQIVYDQTALIKNFFVVPRLFEEKRRDIVFGIPSFRPSVRPSVLPSFRPPNIVGTLCAQLLLQFYADSFETLQMF